MPTRSIESAAVGTRVLVVDDDAAIRMLLMALCRRLKYESDAAADGVEALELMQGARYDLMLLDLMMPRMNGFEVLDHLRTLPDDVRPLVLVLTAGLQPKKFDASYVVGMMQKPFDVELLLDTVSGCLAAAAERPQLDSCSDGPQRARAEIPDEPN